MEIDIKELLHRPQSFKQSDIFSQLLHKWIRNYRIILYSVIVSLIIAFLFKAVTTPTYRVTTSFLLKNEIGSPGAATNDLLNYFSESKNQYNINNEIQVLRSRQLIESVIVTNNLNVKYYERLGLRKQPVKSSSVKLVMMQKPSQNGPITFEVESISKTSFKLQVKAKSAKFSGTYDWGQRVKYQDFEFIISRASVLDKTIKDLTIVWYSTDFQVDETLRHLQITNTDKKSSVVEVSLDDPDVNASEVFLASLLSNYRRFRETETDNNLINGSKFINGRLSIVSQELSAIEDAVADFKGKNNIVDFNSQGINSINQSQELSKQTTDLEVRQKAVHLLQEYLSTVDTRNQLIPSSLGVDDEALSSLISKYNSIQQLITREAGTVTETNPELVDHRTQLELARQAVQSGLANIQSQYELELKQVKDKNLLYKDFLDKLPTNEQKLQEMQRRQKVTEQLYLFLLQKREESALSSSVHRDANFQIVDPIHYVSKNGRPAVVSPKGWMVFGAALLSGLFASLVIILLPALLSSKLRDRAELTHNLAVPVIAELSKTACVNDEFKLDHQLERQLEVLKGRLMLFPADKVLGVISYESSSGKTTTANKFSALLCATGKKVALVRFSNQATLQLHVVEDINIVSAKHSVRIQNNDLDVFTIKTGLGTIQDALIDPDLSSFFAKLRTDYNHIVIDSASIELSPGTVLLEKHCDVLLIVLSYGMTSKRSVKILNELFSDKFRNKIAVLVNRIPKSKRKAQAHGYDG